jgi:hypothetical protein
LEWEHAVNRCLSFVAGVVAVLLMASGDRAIAQQDPPARVARLNHVEGRVSFAQPDGEWGSAELNRPLLRGDSLWADHGTRAEIQIGSTVVRMDGNTRLKVLALGDDTAQLGVTQGSVQLRASNLPQGENIEIDTPNLAYRMAYPGVVRIDVNGQGASTTRVSIRSGAGAVYADEAQAVPLGDGQQAMFRARSLDRVAVQEAPQDNFDRWAAERDRRDARSVAARFVPRELVGYQWLDESGQWSQDPSYGAVWFPSARPEWAPYRYGRWEWIAPWGWTWIDEEPWAFAPSHYGRWTMIGVRWAWVPGRLPPRPAYAPALVAFIGGAGATALTVGGKTGVAWFPLAPSEPWQAAGSAESQYKDRVNAAMRPLPATGYAYQRKPEALTAMAAEDFARGKPLRAGRQSLSPPLLAQAQIVPPPGLPKRVGDSASLQAQAEQQAATEQARRAEQERQTQQRAAEQASQQAKAPARAEQAKSASAKKRVAQPKKTQQASRQPAAKREAKKGAPQQAQRTQPKRATTAKKPEPDPRSAHAQQVEAARRAADREAQLLRAQREEAERRRQEQERARTDTRLRQQQVLGG